MSGEYDEEIPDEEKVPSAATDRAHRAHHTISRSRVRHRAVVPCASAGLER